MATLHASNKRFPRALALWSGLALAVIAAVAGFFVVPAAPSPSPIDLPRSGYTPRKSFDTSGFPLVLEMIEQESHWPPLASPREIATYWDRIGYRGIDVLDKKLAGGTLSTESRIAACLAKAMLFSLEGKPDRTYQVLLDLRTQVEADGELAREWLYSIIYFQGATALRRGENDNCILCRGESSCILPISTAAIHTNPWGSTQAIRHFTEYLQQFPGDLEARWLLNLAHMTLGQHPDRVDPRFLISLDRFRDSELDIGRFRDVGHLVGLNKFNQAGSAVLEDFDNDGLLDVAVTSIDPLQVMSIYRNTGDGHFEDKTKAAGVSDQLGGLYCVQTDYDNDGLADLYIPRGAWLKVPMCPTLLRNNGGFRFTDVTEAAGLLDPVNSNSAAWADYDNDGWLDLFVCCEAQSCRLFHNLKDGTFEEMSTPAGLGMNVRSFCKGAAWIDFDNDNFPDLFLNHLSGRAQLFRNNREGTFTEVTSSLGIDGPNIGFSCWAWDYDNDGWLDIFATSYDHRMQDVLKGLLGQPHDRNSNRLFRNLGGKGFQDVTREAGLDLVFAAMGSNFADFDNDGFLDLYLGTGNPRLDTLVPNRMFKNVNGKRFSEITGSSGTGHLQKGHGVACGDWDRDGDVDLFIEMGGTINGDKYHNVLFQNPGQGRHSLTVKLIGTRTNRAAIGARIKVVTAGAQPATMHRHVSSGSSFGANPLEQTIGVGEATVVDLLEIHWPTSGATQTFRNIDADQCIEITELEETYRKLPKRTVKLPEAGSGMATGS